jgi:nitrite reductase (NO-forming)
VGGHHVRERGNIEDPPARDLEVWVNVSGSVGDFKYTFQQLGTYIYRSHNLIEAFMLSSVSEIKVELERDNDLMEQVKKPSPIK